MDAARNEICMMFTGGVDTTLAAAQLLEGDASCRLHLLTFCNGMCVGVERSGIHVEELRKIYGADRIIHQITYVTEIFEELRRPIWEQIRKARSTLAVDLCCRLSFETAAIIHCVNNGLTRLADGTNVDQGRLFLEKPEYLKVTREFFAEYGVEYFSPVYQRLGGREGRIEELRRRGLTVGPKASEKINIGSSLMHQPFCFFGIHTFFFTSFMRDVPLLGKGIARLSLKLEDAIALRHDRQEVARSIIARRTATASEDVDGGLRITEQFCTTRLCGRNGVEVSLPRGATIDLDALVEAWGGGGEVFREGDYLRTRDGATEIEVFRDGRVIVTGTRDSEQAVAIYRDRVALPGVISVEAAPIS
ncbi:MAG: hypothetical protein ABIK09_18975 [Pseudomonadota bacterium]